MARAGLAQWFLRSLGSDSEPTTDVDATPREPSRPAGWWDLLPFTSHRIELADRVFTMDEGVDASRDVRAQLVVDELDGKLGDATIVDLGCLEGGFALEFARRGAGLVVGIEARDVSVRRCELARRLIGLENVEFVRGDIVDELPLVERNIDVVFAAGILYHLAEPGPFLAAVRQACSGLVLIDTHVSHKSDVTHGCSAEIVEHPFAGTTFRGRTFYEFDPSVDEAQRAGLLWASWTNPTSFWPLEVELVRMLRHAGFKSITKVDTSTFSQEEWQVDHINRVMYLCRAVS